MKAIVSNAMRPNRGQPIAEPCGREEAQMQALERGAEVNFTHTHDLRSHKETHEDRSPPALDRVVERVWRGARRWRRPYGGKSVAWYMAHQDAWVAQLGWCQEQSADVQMQSQGCAQAGVAAQKAWLNSGKHYVSGN